MPARSDTTRAMLVESEGWATFPRITSSTSRGSTPWRARSSDTATRPSSRAETPARAIPDFAKGVRKPSISTTSRISSHAGFAARARDGIWPPGAECVTVISGGQRMDVRTIPDLLRYARRTHPKRDAFLVKREGRWEPVSTEEFAARVAALAASLRARGVRHGDRVVILSENRLEWAIADFAILSIAAISVPLYPTLPAAELAPLLTECTPVGAFVSTRAQREKIEVSAASSGLRWIHCF